MIMAFRQFSTWLARHQSVCAWCERTIRRGGPLSFFRSYGVSHGICKTCSYRELQRARQCAPERSRTRLRNRLELLLMAGVFLFLSSCTSEPTKAEEARRYRATQHAALEVTG